MRVAFECEQSSGDQRTFFSFWKQNRLHEEIWGAFVTVQSIESSPRTKQQWV